MEEDSLNAIVDMVRVLKVPAKNYVIRAGDDGDSMFFIQVIFFEQKQSVLTFKKKTVFETCHTRQRSRGQHILYCLCNCYFFFIQDGRCAIEFNGSVVDVHGTHSEK